MQQTWILLAACVTWANAQWTPIVNVESGKVRGIVERDIRMHKNFHSFMGIPYATVTHRFQAAKPVQPWDDVFEAINGVSKCMQRGGLAISTPPGYTSVTGVEDCLTLNVYTHEDKSQTKPVMVFIHGGGFRDGSASSLIYGPEYFLRQDVVLVAINYRVEILGFLCLGIKEAPGNVGLKDQVAALKWIKNNIRAFGGNPEDITIFGQSAGSASVMYHLLSPMSTGLFNKAVMQSGSATSYWTLQFEPLKVASKLAKQMGFNTKDPHELYNIFTNKSAKELLRARVPRNKGDIVQSENIFVPCIEKEIPGIDAFLTDNPYNIISQGNFAKVPMIIGYNNEEGYYFVGKENVTTIENISVYKSLPRDLHFPSEKIAKETAKTLKKLYFGNGSVNLQTLKELVKFEGELGISFPTVDVASLILRTNTQPVYIYKFAYSGLLNLVKILSGFGAYPGASHADELTYMFKPKLTGLSGFFETDIIKKMTTMWGNFAKYGNPTPQGTSVIPIKWQAAKLEKPKILVIDKEITTEPLWTSETYAFLNETYSLYRRLV